MDGRRIILMVAAVSAVLGVAGCAQQAAPAPAALNIEMEPAGHWHVTHEKTLTFTVTDDAGNPVTGLSPMLTVKTLQGSEEEVAATDNGDGTYSAAYLASDIGGGYASAYSVAFWFEHEGARYFEAWPTEVVRDGNEGIMPTIGGTMYAYQVRYGWDPADAQAGDEITMYLEPRRSMQTGDQINTEMPWRNTFNHISALEDVSVLVETADGDFVASLDATYAGLGIYRATFTPAAAGEFKVSFLFTDPMNGFTIDKGETSYPLTVG